MQQAGFPLDQTHSARLVELGLIPLLQTMYATEHALPPAENEARWRATLEW